jgi:DNA polymerase-3 subunit beta
MVAEMILNSKQAAAALSRLLPVAAGKDRISGMVLVEPGAGMIRCTASNLVQWLSVSIECESDFRSPVVLELKPLVSLLRSASDDVYITLDPEAVRVRSGKSRYTLRPPMPAGDYPERESVEVAATLRCNEKSLQAALHAVLACVAGDDVRYYLRGVHVRTRDGVTFVEATDGHRLARATVAGAEADGDIDLILPTITATMLSKAQQDDVLMQISDGEVSCIIGTDTLTSKTVDGRYPDADRVIPRDCPHELVLDREAALKALAAVSVIGSAYDAVLLKIEESGISIVRSDTNGQQASAEVEAEAHTNPSPMEIGMRAEYLRSVLQSAISDTVSIGYQSPDSAILVQPETYVLMPVRI